MTDILGKTIGHQLQLAARLHRARIAEAIQDLGLFPGQEPVLQLLANGEKLSVGDLARMLRVRPPTISKTVQRLSQQGLILREDHDTDARRARIALTKEGLRRAGELRARLDGVESELTDRLDGKEQRRLRKLLKRAAKALTPSERDEADADAGDADDSDD